MRKKVRFIVDKKEDLLQGRTLKYIHSLGMECTIIHLSNILNGNNVCSRLLAKDIVRIARPDKNLEDYFVEE